MIGSITSATAPTTSNAAGGLASLGGDAFLKLMVAQLRFQNPLAPSDPSAMLQQTAQFTQVETLQAVAKAQREIAGLQQVALAAQLVGKEVTAVTGDATTVRGVVDSVRFTADGPMLLIGDQEVPLAATSSLGAVPG